MTRSASPIARGLLLGAIALTLPGCWISQAAFENALCKLDEDGDGDPRCGLSNTVQDGDCDDSNPYMSNLRTETGEGVLDERGEDAGGAYDGLDNDCSGGDLIDVDGDGYPGITRADYEAKGGEPWPAEMPDELDCHDLPIEGMPAGFEQGVYPGAPEIFYDGVDGNCDGGDDFDQDGDGFASRTYVDVYDGELDATDCNDNDDTVNPDVPDGDEVFYDGEDQNCSQDNDFDPDGDGRLTVGYNDEVTTYVDQYDYDGAPWVPWIPDADCLDLGDAFSDGTDTIGPDVTVEIASAAFSRVPGDPDCEGVAEGASCESTWYDGIDDACDDIDGRGGVLRTDFDQDGDGYLRTIDKANFRAYVQRYAVFTDSRGEQPYRAAMIDEYGDGDGGISDASIDAWFDAHDNDCVDTDPAINPQALEVLGDGIDQDCDTGNDTARFAFGRFTFDDPGPVRMASTPDYHVMLVNASGGVDLDDGFGVKLPRVVAMSWNVDEQLASNVTLDGTPYNVTKGSDALHYPVHVTAWGRNTFSAITWSSTRTRMQAQLSTPTTGTHFRVLTRADAISRSAVAFYTGGDLRCDTTDTLCWQVACDGESVQWSIFDRTTSMTYRGDGLEVAVDAQECFVLPGHLSGDGTLIYTVDSGGALSAWEDDFGLLSPVVPGPLDGLTATFARSHGDWLILGQSSGLRLVRSPSEQATVLTGTTFIDADAAVVQRDGADWWAIAGIRSNGTLELAYGPASSLTRVVLPVQTEAGEVTPTSVAVTVTNESVMVGVRGSDGAERVGWALIQAP